jgi:DnaJ-class molecular chaperone
MKTKTKTKIIKVRCLNCLGHGAIDVKGTKCPRCKGTGIESIKGSVAGLYKKD